MGNRNSGRRPIPTALKVLRGNPGHRRLNEQEPKPPVGAVAAPARLSSGAAIAWSELAPACIAMGTLTTADVSAFTTLCELRATADLIAAKKSMRKFRPLVGGKENPLLKMERHTAASLRPYYEKFGLEPVGRARIHVAQPEKPASKWAGALA